MIKFHEVCIAVGVLWIIHEVTLTFYIMAITYRQEIARLCKEQ